jgi:hypothetical protein
LEGVPLADAVVLLLNLRRPMTEIIGPLAEAAARRADAAKLAVKQLRKPWWS